MSRLLAAVALGLSLSLPSSHLAVRDDGGEWRTWWRAAAAPARWAAADARVSAAVRWRPLREGMELGELDLAGTGEARRLRVVLVRLDPARFRFALESRTRGRRHGTWTVDSAPDAAVLAFNTGQFTSSAPWGWLVQEGRERRTPGVGPLSMAVAADGAAIDLVPAAQLPAYRAARRPHAAFQSYPTLLDGDGTVPEALQAAGRGVDVAHRDSRFAIGRLRDGRILLALTRVGDGDGTVGELPLGLTVPEMAALMGALGCAQAVSLDGGISGQLLARDATGRTQAWRAWRKVPVGMVVYERR